MNTPKKNYIYNVVYQILIFIIPLIISPYISRIIGTEGVGIYSYTYSIVYYFMLLTLLGVNNYGNRTIAKIRENKIELSKNFWSIYIIQLIMGIVMLIIYILYILSFDIKYKDISIIETLFIVSAVLDINWFFFGLEEFKKTVIRNTIIKIGNVILIFLFVKNQNDLWKYTLIMAGMTCLSQIILWNFLKNKIMLVKVTFNDIKKHIKPNLILFIPVIAISLYKIMDKIMLGSLSSVSEVGFYENAEKIINVPMALINALGTVMLPRISNILTNGEEERIYEYIIKSIKFIMFMAFAMCFGLIGIGYNFAPIYYGAEFQKTGLLIMLLAITIPFLSFANVLRTQYLIPKEKDNIYIISVISGAIVNFILNLIFIPKLGSTGACLGTIAAEFAVMFIQTFYLRKELEIKKYFAQSKYFFISSLVMLIFVYAINYINVNNILKLFIQIVLGCIIYCLLNIKYILSILNIKIGE